MRRTLLVTNDFPPVVSGIPSYLQGYAARLPRRELVVLTSTPTVDAALLRAFDEEQPFDVVRYPARTLPPTPGLKASLQGLIRSRGIETLWFGTPSPLGLLSGAAKKAGASRVLVSTYDRAQGRSTAIPGSRVALRQMLRHADAVSYAFPEGLGSIQTLLAPGTHTLHLPKLPADVEKP